MAQVQEQSAAAHAPGLDRAGQGTPYRAILAAADASDHADRGIAEAAGLAALGEATVTGIHVYAARLHDRRFRQMEGGLPEPYRQEQALEHQREVHNELIGRGLGVIADSYLAQAQQVCARHAVAFRPCTREGRNYLELVREANSGGYDLLVLGAQGLGRLDGSGLGSVCVRAARRSRVDTLVIKDPARSIADGPIAVAVDGSGAAFGGLRTALALAARWGVAVHVFAAYDPHFHYVAFERLRGVLSDEAGRMFRFEEQERLHEDIIDNGLARIYQSHLQVAAALAAEAGIAVHTELLAGKPALVLAEQMHVLRPSLLVVGRVGIHADAELDLGATSEHLLRVAPCAMLLSSRSHEPPVQTVAQASTSWTREAQAALERVPEFARPMVRIAILGYAHERGHTVVTAQIVAAATASLCPHRRAPGGGA